MLRLRFTLLFLLGALLFSYASNNDDSGKKAKTLPQNTIKFDYCDNLIYLNAFIDDINGHFIFDTGAEQLHLDSIFYANNNFRYEERTTVMGDEASNLKIINCIKNKINVKANGSILKSKFTPILDIKKITGDETDGIVGGRLFSNNVIKINYITKSISIYHSINELNIDGYKKIKLKKTIEKINAPSPYPYK